MELIITRCCGLDVHKASVTACARLVHEDGRLSELVETFTTTMLDLLALRDWLKGAGSHACRHGGHGRLLKVRLLLA